MEDYLNSFSNSIKQKRVSYMLNIIKKYNDKYNLKFNNFIECGMYEGDIIFGASFLYEKCYGIEINKDLYEKILLRNNNYKRDNIYFSNGDVIDKLPDILNQIDNGIFWLDAHYAGPGTGGEFDYLPILEELQFIISWNKPCLVLIDDVNKFGEKHKCKNQKYTGYKEHDIDWTKYSIDKIKKLIG